MREQISNLYKEVFNRDPDAVGLQRYIESGLSIEAIKEDMMRSAEYVAVLRKKEFVTSLEKNNPADLLIIGASPVLKEHENALKAAKIEAILDLNIVPTTKNNYPWCKSYKHISTSRNMPLSAEKAKAILEYMYHELFVEKHKLYIHSELGMTRAPMAVALFLVADRSINVFQAIKIVVHKHEYVNPQRIFLSPEALSVAKEFKNTIKNIRNKPQAVSNTLSSTGSIISISPSLFVTFGKITDQDINKNKIDVIYDLYASSQGEIVKKEIVHLPVSPDVVQKLIPVVVKATVKRASMANVLVMFENMGIMLFYIEILYKELGNTIENITPLDKIRMQLMAPNK